MRILYIFSALMIISLSVIFTCFYQNGKKEDIVIARVGQVTLFESQLPPVNSFNVPVRDKKQIIEDYVDRWVNTQLIYQEARRNGFDKTPFIVQELSRIEKEMVVEYFIDKILNRETNVNEYILREYYENLKYQFVTNIDLYKITLLAVNSRKKVNLIENELKNNKSLYEISRSIDNANLVLSPEQFISLEDIPRDLRPFVSSLPAGRMIKQKYLNKMYFYVEMITKKPKGSPKELVEIRNMLYQIASNDIRKEKYQKLLSDLKFQKDFFIISDFEMLFDSTKTVQTEE